VVSIHDGGAEHPDGSKARHSKCVKGSNVWFVFFFSFKKEILKSEKAQLTAWWGPSCAFQKFLWHLRGGEHPQNTLKRNLGGSLQTRGRNYHIGEDLEIQNDMVIVYKPREERRVSWMSVHRSTKGRNYHIG
jgi:hypothetical protein